MKRESLKINSQGKPNLFKRINWSFALPVVLILLAALISSWLLREKPTLSRGERVVPAVTVEVARAERGSFPLTVTALGKVSAREFVELQPQVEGRVEWLDYDLGPGSTLKKGQLLLRIEAEPYELALQSAQSSLAERRAELQQEEGQRLVAQEEFELLGESLPQADRALVLREPQLAAARARVAAAEAQVNLARRDLRLSKITAPFTALMVSRSVDVGDRVGPGTVLYSLAGADRFQIEVEVPASQLSLLDDEGAEVRIHGSQWQASQYRRGEFVRVIPVLEEQGRLARVLVELADPLAIDNPAQPPLLLNDLARVEITGRAAGERVRIPLTALQDGDVVWVVENGQIRIQPVRVGYLSDQYAVLDSGLQGGESLVTTRLTTVTGGMKVRIADGSGRKPGVQRDQRPGESGRKAPAEIRIRDQVPPESQIESQPETPPAERQSPEIPTRGGERG